MLQPGQLIGQYRILKRLKKGGMGEVYLAEDQHLLHRQVAIKIIWTDDSHYDDIDKAQEAIHLFQREARMLAKFNHSHILPVYDAQQDTINGMSCMYLVMPYCRQGSLTDWLHTYSQHGKLTLWDVERIVKQAADALQCAHNLNIVHQDVKPANFLIYGDAQYPGELHLQLADFGVAKFINTSGKSQAIRGTPQYMAPEQWNGRPTAATDQYGLAIMVYELLTGRLPFTGDNHQQWWYQHTNVHPLYPSSINRFIPRSLDTVIMKALAKQPEQRYESVTAFADAFRHALLHAHHASLPNPKVRETVSVSNISTIPRTVPAVKAPPVRPPDDEVPEPVEPFIPRKGRSKTSLMVLLCVVLVIVTASIGSLLYNTWANQQTPLSNATATVLAQNAKTQATITAMFSNQTATANRNATFIAQANETNTAFTASANATATRNAQLTSTAQAYATETQIANQQATATAIAVLTGGTGGFTDALQDNNQNHSWDTIDNPDGSCQFSGGTYHSGATQGGSVQSCFAQNTDLIDFSYIVQMTIIKGDVGGVAFRGDEGRGTYYYFHLGTDGSCGLDYYSGDLDMGTIKSCTNLNLHIALNQPVTIATVAVGTTITILVNTQTVINITDMQYNHGQIGLVAQDISDPTDVSFKNVVVRQK